MAKGKKKGLLNPDYQYEFATNQGEDGKNILTNRIYAFSENDEGGKSYQLSGESGEDKPSKFAYGNILGAKTIEEWMNSPAWAQKFNDPNKWNQLTEVDFKKLANAKGYVGPKTDPDWAMKYILGVTTKDGKELPYGQWGGSGHSQQKTELGMFNPMVGGGNQAVEAALGFLQKNNKGLYDQFQAGVQKNPDGFNLGDGIAAFITAAGVGGAVSGAGALAGGLSAADTAALTQMGIDAGLSGSALDAFVASGGTLGSTAAGGGGVLGLATNPTIDPTFPYQAPTNPTLPGGFTGGGGGGTITDGGVINPPDGGFVGGGSGGSIVDGGIDPFTGGAGGGGTTAGGVGGVMTGPGGVPIGPGTVYSPIDPTGGVIPGVPPGVPTPPGVPGIPNTPGTPPVDPGSGDTGIPQPPLDPTTPSIPGTGFNLEDFLRNQFGNINWGNVLSGVLQGGLGYVGADKMADAYTDASNKQLALANEWANKYFNVGAPYRDLLQTSYQPGFDLWSQPGYKDAAEHAANVSTRAWSTQGNPANNPGIQGGIYGDVLKGTLLPGLTSYRGQLGQFGGMGMNTSGGILGQGMNNANQANLAGINASGGGWEALGAGMGTIFGGGNNPFSNFNLSFGGRPWGY